MTQPQPEKGVLTPREARLRIEARIEALRTQRDFFRAVDMDVAADHCEEAAIGWEGSLADLLRNVDHVYPSAEPDECERCEGTGDIYGRSRGPIAICPDCDGSGNVTPPATTAGGRDE